MNFADDIKRSVSIQQVAELYGLRPNRAGFILCPFHHEKTASMKLYSNGSYHCFGCGKSGDVISFVMDLDGLGFVDACKKLNDAFALGLPIGEKVSRRAECEAGRRAWERKRQIKEAAKQAQAVSEAFWSAYDEWAEKLSEAEKLAPKESWQPMTGEYIEAIMEADLAQDRLEEAERNLYEYEKTH